MEHDGIEPSLPARHAGVPSTVTDAPKPENPASRLGSPVMLLWWRDRVPTPAWVDYEPSLSADSPAANDITVTRPLTPRKHFPCVPTRGVEPLTLAV